MYDSAEIRFSVKYVIALPELMYLIGELRTIVLLDNRNKS